MLWPKVIQKLAIWISQSAECEFTPINHFDSSNNNLSFHVTEILSRVPRGRASRAHAANNLWLNSQMCEHNRVQKLNQVNRSAGTVISVHILPLTDADEVD